MDEIANPIAGLIQYLTNDPVVGDLTGGRIFAMRLPPGESNSMPRGCMVLAPAGGRMPESYMLTTTPRIDVFCYGADELGADRLQAAASLALQNLNRKVLRNTMLYNATHSSGPHWRPTEPNMANWPCVYSTWLVKSHLVSPA